MTRLANLEKNIHKLDVKRLESFDRILETYLRPLDQESQKSSHHKKETTQEHVLMVVDTLTHLLIFLRKQDKKQADHLEELAHLEEELQRKLSAHMQNRLKDYLSQEIEGKDKATLIFYAALLHDSGKIDLLDKYKKNFGQYDFFAKHDLFGAILVNYYEDALKEIAVFESQLEEKKKQASTEGKKGSIANIEQAYKYLELIKKFIIENREIIESAGLTRSQLNYISELIKEHTALSSAFNKYKKHKTLQDASPAIRRLDEKGILIGELMLFYADVMACLHIFGHNEIKTQLISFIAEILNTSE